MVFEQAFSKLDVDAVERLHCGCMGLVESGVTVVCIDREYRVFSALDDAPQRQEFLGAFLLLFLAFGYVPDIALDNLRMICRIDGADKLYIDAAPVFRLEGKVFVTD